MMTAMKTENNALEEVRNKLLEVDNLRSQINTFTMKLLEADQANLNMKTIILMLQEQYNDAKKAKLEVSKSKSKY
jgi:hypothetical protein